MTESKGGAPAVDVVDRAAAAGAAILDGRDLWSDLPSATSRAILLSALESFATRGFHATSLRHIADGTGLSTAALYVHFRSKEQLLFEMGRRGHQVALDIVTAAAALPAPTDAIGAVVYAFTRWHAEQRTTARVVQYELGGLGPEHAEEIGDLRRRTERTVRELISRGLDDGSFSVPDVRGACTAILSLGIDVARWYRPDGPYSPDGLGRLYCALAGRLLGTAASAGTTTAAPTGASTG